MVEFAAKAGSELGTRAAASACNKLRQDTISAKDRRWAECVLDSVPGARNDLGARIAIATCHQVPDKLPKSHQPEPIPKQATEAQATSIKPAPAPARSEADSYLGSAAASLTTEQFGIASGEWLAAHREYSNPQAISSIQSHLNLVLRDYPAIETRAALDMALQRTQRVWREELARRAQAERSPRRPPPTSAPVQHHSEASLDAFEDRPTASELQDAYYQEAIRATTGGTYISTPSWEAMKQGRTNEVVLPIDPSKVVPEEE